VFVFLFPLIDDGNGGYGSGCGGDDDDDDATVFVKKIPRTLIIPSHEVERLQDYNSLKHFMKHASLSSSLSKLFV
jgi:hypothetical protein